MNVQVALFRKGANGGAIRWYDCDAERVAGIKFYMSFEQATAAFNKAVRIAAA